MQITTRAIVLRTVKYSDKASVATVFTREMGRVTFMAYGVSGKKSGGKAALLQPLSIVELTLMVHPGREVQQLKDIRADIALPGISAHPVKNAIAFFIAELLFNVLNQQQEELQLFDFLSNALQFLNESEEGTANFHLVLMCRLTRFLGFEPDISKTDALFFDLLNGGFSATTPLHPHIVKPGLLNAFTSLVKCSFSDMSSLELSRQSRNELLDILLEYYRLHLSGFHTLQSKAILHELFG